MKSLGLGTVLVFCTLLAACAGTKIKPMTGDAIAELPQMRIGEKWRYQGAMFNETIEKEVVAVNDDGSFVATLFTNGKKKALVSYDADHQVIAISGEAPVDFSWDTCRVLRFPLFVGKTFKVARDLPSINKMRRGSASDAPMDNYEFSFKVADYSTALLGGFEVHLFRLDFNIYRFTDGWSNQGKLYYSPDLKSIFKVVPGWRPGSELIGFKVRPGAIFTQLDSGPPLQESVPSPPSGFLALGFSTPPQASLAVSGEKESLTRELELLRAERARIEREAAERLQETERKAAEELAAARGAADALAAEKLAAEQRAAEQLATAKQLAAQQASAQRAADQETSARRRAEQRAAEARAAEEQAAARLAAEERANGIAIIIGNRNYARHNPDVPDVSYAHADADAIYRYVHDVLGYQEGNILLLKDATQAEMTSVFGNERNHRGKLFNWVKPGKSDLFVYYSGHGAPGLNDGSGYLLPVNGDPMTVELNGYPLETLYQNLAKTPARQVTVVLDACFSGSSAQGSIVRNASSIALRRVETQGVLDNGSVLTAAGVAEVASWDQERKQGLFTAYFLEGVSGAADDEGYGDGDGRVRLGELKGYLQDKVSYWARRNYYREQHPQISGDESRVMAVLNP